jgi:hypothetical protein
MNSNRVPKIRLNYGPNGRRRLGGPLKSLLNEAETVLSRPFSGWLMMVNMMMIIIIIIQSLKTIISQKASMQSQGDCFSVTELLRRTAELSNNLAIPRLDLV